MRLARVRSQVRRAQRSGLRIRVAFPPWIEVRFDMVREFGGLWV